MNRILLFVILCIFTLQSCIKQETISYQAQFKSDTELVRSFVSSNDSTAIKVSTGFWYSIDTLRNGVYPAQSDEITISYKVKWIKSTSKTEADLDTVGHSKLTIELLSAAISGLQQGLSLFPAGSYGRLYLPSGLAFGMSGHKKMITDTADVNIPPNANLLYEIKLISVKSTRLASDITTIDSYLQSHSITALHDDSSGIRYTIDAIDSTAINPPKPNATDSILVTYKEKTLTFDSLTIITSVDTPTKIALKDQITAWRIMLHNYVAEGTKITMYVPSGYAYGSFGKNSVPPIPSNSNMVYTITLKQVN